MTAPENQLERREGRELNGHAGGAAYDFDAESEADTQLDHDLAFARENSGKPRRPRVVIVGAGFGGINAALALRKAPVDITIIDRHNYHCFQPLLYQVATATLSPADIAWPVRTLFRRDKNVTVLLAEVSSIDTKAQIVTASGDRFPYDYLILASGVTHSYFGHPEWEDVAPGLKTIEDATAIRRAMLLAFEKAELAHTEAERRKYLTFVVVGGGPTGVEMAGAIADVAHNAQPDFRRFNAKDAIIKLIEAGPRVLPALPENLSAYAARSLQKMGVEVETSMSVTACTEDGVDTTKGFIEAGTIVWAAGVVASPAGKWIGAKVDRAGRVEVNEDLSVPGFSNIFAIGDTAAAKDSTGKPVPGIAPAAKQMGKYVGRKILAEVQGKPAPSAFHYRHHGDLATIGRGSAVVRLDYLSLKGFVGWVFWSAAHVYYLIGLRNRLAVFLSWIWHYVTFQQGARLITGYDAGHPPETPGSAERRKTTVA